VCVCARARTVYPLDDVRARITCTLVGMPACLYVCMSVCLYICMPVHLYTCMLVSLYVCMWCMSRARTWPGYLPGLFVAAWCCVCQVLVWAMRLCPRTNCAATRVLFPHAFDHLYYPPRPLPPLPSFSTSSLLSPASQIDPRRVEADAEGYSVADLARIAKHHDLALWLESFK